MSFPITAATSAAVLTVCREVFVGAAACLQVQYAKCAPDQHVLRGVLTDPQLLAGLYASCQHKAGLPVSYSASSVDVASNCIGLWQLLLSVFLSACFYLYCMYRAYVTICWSAIACSRQNIVTELHCASCLDLCHRHNASHQSQYSLQLLRTSDDKPLHGQPLWERSDLDPGQLINEFQRECHVVRRSIDGDLVKASSRRAYLACSTHHCDPPWVFTRANVVLGH